MNARRLEEIFEECVSAYLEGRRSIQESLQLYPACVAELAPLLQTAVQLNDSFGKITPPAHVQSRVHGRFLSDARSRRQVRSLTRGHGRSGIFAAFWQRQRFGFAAAAGAIAVLAVAVGSAAMLMGGGTAGGPGNVGNLTTTPASQRATPATVTNIRTSTSNIRDRGQAVRSADIEELVSATTDLAAVDPDELQNAKADVEQALREADSALNDIAASSPDAAVAAQAQQAKDTLRSVASNLEIDLDATPTPTASPVPTAPPTTAPTAEPTAEPTDAPTPEPTPVPTEVPPTPTPVRGPAVG